MPLFKFEDFIYDPDSHNLNHDGTKISIRPKALKLLSLLIQNRHRVVSKDEIMSSVWGNDFVRDYQLFQLISELRKPPFRSEFVHTIPNEGYQWNVKTKIVNKPIFAPQLVAASVVIGLICLSLVTYPILNNADSSPKQAMQLPAFSALSKGIIALDNGDKVKAIEWFEFALVENPNSATPSLFLAETLYQMNKPNESSKYLHDLLQQENLSAYNQAAVANILSRINEQQGRFDDALIFAQKSSQTKVAGQCSIDFVEQRIVKLKSDIAMSPIQSTKEPEEPEDPEDPNKNMYSVKNYAHQCNQLKNNTIETSMCLPLTDQHPYYVMNNRRQRFLIS